MTEFWNDEVSSIDFVQTASYQDILLQKGKYHDYAHPSGYYLLLKAWLHVVPAEDSLIRALSLIFYFPAVFLVFLIARRLLHNHPASIFAVIEFCFHPTLANLSFQARMYSISMFCTLLSIWCFQRFLDKPHQQKQILWLCLATAATVYTDYAAVWLLVIYGAYAVYYLKTRPALIKSFLQLFVGIGLLTFPQFWVLIAAHWKFGYIIPGSVPQGKAFPYEFILIQLVDILGLPTTLYGTFNLFVSGGVLVLIFQSIKRKLRFEQALIIFPLLASLVFSILFYHIFLARNLFIVSLGICFLFAYLLLEFWRKKQVFQLCVLLCCCLLQLSSSWTFQGFYITQGAKKISNAIKQEQGYAVFLPGAYPLIYLDYYFPRAGLDASSELFLHAEDNVESVMKPSTRPYYIFYAYDCAKQAECEKVKHNVDLTCERVHCAGFQQL